MKECISLEHDQNKPIKCDICNVAFPKNAYVYKAYIKPVHEQNKPFKSEIKTK